MFLEVVAWRYARRAMNNMILPGKAIPAKRAVGFRDLTTLKGQATKMSQFSKPKTRLALTPYYSYIAMQQICSTSYSTFTSMPTFTSLVIPDFLLKLISRTLIFKEINFSHWN